MYGLRLSANLALPGLPLRLASDVFDVRIWLREWATFSEAFPESFDIFYRSVPEDSPDQPNLRVGLLPGRDYFGLFYGDGVRFAVERRGREVWADWPEDYTIEDACTYLLGPVMGFVLRVRGTVSLHASAVTIEGRAIALVGLTGAGKSTTAAAFACSGCPVVSDDVVALVDKGERFLVPPGYPRVNLWPDSVRKLFGTEEALPPITPTWEKRYLSLGRNGHRFASSPLPLGAIYILEVRDPTLTAPVIETVSAKEALITLVANTYVNYLLDQNMRRTEFDVLSRIVSEIPVRRVHMPDEPSAVFGLCEAIADDAKQVIAAVLADAASVLG